MDLFNLAAPQVAEHADAGFDLRLKCQELLFQFLIETGDVSVIQLSWSQLRSCYQYMQESTTGRLERVR